MSHDNNLLPYEYDLMGERRYDRWGFAAWHTFTSSGHSVRLTGPQHRELDPLEILRVGIVERERLALDEGKTHIAEWTEDGRYPR